MKKNVAMRIALIFCLVLIALGVTAFGYMNMGDSLSIQEETPHTDLDLIYKVESRFMTTITKEDLHHATSIIDIVPKKATESLTGYHDVKVAILHDDDETKAMGENEVLNFAQIMLLQSTDYSTNFYVKANCKNKRPGAEVLEPYELVYYMTIVPEKEAVYADGQDALITYLKENIREHTAIITKDKLRPGQVNFTVTKAGQIENVILNSTSGFPSVDEVLIEKITQVPEKWEPATNSKGEKVDQELVFFFGLMGC